MRLLRAYRAALVGNGAFDIRGHCESLTTAYNRPALREQEMCRGWYAKQA